MEQKKDYKEVSSLANKWLQEWNDIVRNVFWKDDELRSLMCIPSNITILDFIDRYFIRAGYTSKMLTNESVRIIYGNISMEQMPNPKALKERLSFDIFVKYEKLHDANIDRLMYRTNLIAERIKYLLLHQRYLGNYRFWISGQRDMGTSAVGYARYNISFDYIRMHDQ